jgi:hypothetical protein
MITNIFRTSKKNVSKFLTATVAAVLLAVFVMPAFMVAKAAPPTPTPIVMSAGETRTLTETGYMTTGGWSYRVTVYKDWLTGRYTAKIDGYMRYGLPGAQPRYQGAVYTYYVDGNMSSAVYMSLSVTCYQNMKACVVAVPANFSVGVGSYSY